MFRIQRLILSAAIALAVAIPAHADATSEDPVLNRAAYSALLRNEELSDLNIGVRVLEGGTAILWGNATPADSAKAEAVLKRLPGIKRVVNTCDPVHVADPLIERVGAAFKSGTTEKASSDETITQVAATIPVKRLRMTVEKPDEAKLEPFARLGDPTPLPKPLDYDGIQRVRKSDPRFRLMSFDLRDGRVVVAASTTDPTAAWDLARKIAPFVGDRDVVVGKPLATRGVAPPGDRIDGRHRAYPPQMSAGWNAMKWKRAMIEVLEINRAERIDHRSKRRGQEL